VQAGVSNAFLIAYRLKERQCLLRCFYSEVVVFRILFLAKVEQLLGSFLGILIYGRERHSSGQMPTED
jgi:hypothetical protein